MPLHLMNSYQHGEIRSSLAGDSHATTSALHLLDITYGAEAETCVDNAKIMPPQPTKDPTDARWYFLHALTAPDTMYTSMRPRHSFLEFARPEKYNSPLYCNCHNHHTLPSHPGCNVFNLPCVPDPNGAQKIQPPKNGSSSVKYAEAM